MATLSATTLSPSQIPNLQAGDTFTQTDFNTGMGNLRTTINTIIADLATLNTATGQLSATNAWTGTNSWAGTSTFNHITFASTYGVSNTFLITDSDNASTGVDTGLAANRGSSGADALFYWDHSESKWRADSDSSGTLAKIQVADGAASTDTMSYGQGIKLTGSVNETVTGVKTFDSFPAITSYVAPSSNTQFAPKKYVDDQTASLVTGGIIQQTSAPAVTSGNLWIDTTNTSGYRLHRANGSIFGPVGGYHIGTSAPTQPTPAAGHTWIDTTNSTFPTFKYYDGTDWRQSQFTTATGAITFNGALTVAANFTISGTRTIDCGGNKVTNSATPTATTDLVTKAYADALTPKIFASTASAGPNSTVTETTLFGAGTGSLTISGNTLAAGSVIHIRVQGQCDAHSTSDVQTFKVIMGAVTLSTFVMTPVNANDNSFVIDYWITALSVGASGTMAVGGYCHLYPNALTANTTTIAGGGEKLQSASTAMDTTGNLTLNVTCTKTEATSGQTKSISAIVLLYK